MSVARRRIVVSLCMVVAGVVGCLRAPPPLVAPSIAAPAANASPSFELLALAPVDVSCSAPMTTLEADVVNVHVRGYPGSARGRATLTLANCSAESRRLMKVMVSQGEGMAYGFELDETAGVLLPKTQRVVRVPLLWTGKAGIGALVRTASGADEQTPLVVVQMVDDALAEAKYACTMCKGQWGPLYRSGLGCNCRTEDGGSACEDGLQCEGMCLGPFTFRATRTEGKQTLGFLTGRCAPFVHTWSCISRLPEGTRGEPPKVRSDADKGTRICID